MKRVLAVVASLHLAPSHASSGGWGTAGSTAGSGGAWPNHPSNVPPNEPLQGGPVDRPTNGGPPPLESSNHDNGADSLNSGPAAADAPPPAAHHDSPAYHSHPQQHQQQVLQEQHQQHQQHPPPYEPPYIPQQTRWAGQHYDAPAQQHQHQQGNGQFPQYDGYPQSGYPPPSQGDDGSSGDGYGKPLHLGTKWRTLVSRVKDAVRPGQPSPEDYWQGAEGYAAGYGNGGGREYSAPESSWVGGVNENTQGYNPPPPSVNGRHSQRADANTGFVGGHDQQQQQPGPPVPAAAGYDPFQETAGQGSGGAAVGGPAAAASYDYQQDQQHPAAPPPTFFVPQGPPAQQPPGLPHDVGGGGDGGQGDGGSWQAPPPAAPEGVQQQPPASFGGNDAEGSSNAHGHVTQNAGGYGGGGGGDSRTDMYGATIVAEGGHGTTAGERLPTPEPPPETIPASAPVVGQGWSSTPSVDTAAAAYAKIAQQGPAWTSGERGATTTAESGTPPHVRDGQPPPLPSSGSASGSTGSQGDSVPGGASMTPASRPLGGAAVADDAEVVEGGGDVPAAAIDAFSSGSGGSTRMNESGGVMDTMPSSADHGLEKVDWGKGAEEAEEDGVEEGRGGREGAEGESGETEAVPGTEEGLELDREEKALIRELERMDSSIGGGEDPPDIGRGGMGVSSSGSGCETPLPPPPPPPPPVEDQARIDEAVEHQLDDLFDSIVLDGDIVDVGEERNPSDASDVSIPGDVDVDEELVSSRHDRPPVSAAAGEAQSIPLGEDQSSTDGGEAGKRAADSWQDAATTTHSPPAIPTTTSGADPAAPPAASSNDDPPPQSVAPPPASSTWTTATVDTDERQAAASWEGSSSSSASATLSEAVILPEGETAAGSGSGSGSGPGPLWGNTRRWESLPPQPAAVVSDPGEEREEEDQEEEEEEEEDKDEGGSHDLEEEEADVRVPLDPIELPPSAATDEIWNDQHLQDQLDAYWEQSRRGGVQRQQQLSTGVRRQQEEQQLSAYGHGSQTQLQPTYGPGDWVGTGGGASRTGGGGMSSEPLPGGVARAGGWVPAPHLLQGGNQAPINIYGNVHVHLQQGGGVQDGGAQQQQPQQGQGQHSSLSAELSARERYYSQGETSWSGSDRGGQ